MEIHGNENKGRILPEAENENGDEKHFKWWGNEW
jgi:hypothetical protein